MIGLNHYLILSAILFVMGMVGMITRKNLLMIFFAGEIMLNSVNIALVAISNYYSDLTGQLFSFFIIAVAASEVAIGLGLLILWHKRHGTLDLDSLQRMKG
jgi:NADH-quinone oxidoreductase subunit K